MRDEVEKSVTKERDDEFRDREWKLLQLENKLQEREVKLEREKAMLSAIALKQGLALDIDNNPTSIEKMKRTCVHCSKESPKLRCARCTLAYYW